MLTVISEKEEDGGSFLIFGDQYLFFWSKYFIWL